MVNNNSVSIVNQDHKDMTSSLANFLLSLLAGAVIIIIPATVFLVFVSQRDKIQRQ